MLLWPVLRRLGCGGGPTALGIALVGVTPPAVALHSAVTGAAVAVPWLLLAAVLAGRGWLRRVAAGGAVVVAALTAPLVGAAVLALAAHAVLDGTVSRRPGRVVRVGVGIVLAAAAVALAVAAAGHGPLVGIAGPLAGRVVVTVLAAGVVLVVAGWRVRWVRPLLSPAVLLLAALLAPGPGRTVAALAVLPFLAVVLAAVAEALAVRVPGWLRWPLPALAGGAAAVGTVLLLPVPGRGAEPAPSLLLGWMDEQMPPGTTLHADALDRAELIEAGFPAARLRSLGAPVTAADAVLLATRPGAVPTGSCAAGELRATLPWWGGAPAELCGATDPVAMDEAERAGRIRIGTALAGNRGLQLGPDAAELLTSGRVDPRLMIVLSVLATSHTLAVSDFPTAPYEPADSLRRQVLLGSVDGLPTDDTDRPRVPARVARGATRPVRPRRRAGRRRRTARRLPRAHPGGPAAGLTAQRDDRYRPTDLRDPLGIRSSGVAERRNPRPPVARARPPTPWRSQGSNPQVPRLATFAPRASPELPDRRGTPDRRRGRRGRAEPRHRMRLGRDHAPPRRLPHRPRSPTPLPRPRTATTVTAAWREWDRPISSSTPCRPGRSVSSSLTVRAACSYGSDADQTNPPQSHCTDACAQTWLPLTVSGGAGAPAPGRRRGGRRTPGPAGRQQPADAGRLAGLRQPQRRRPAQAGGPGPAVRRAGSRCRRRGRRSRCPADRARRAVVPERTSRRRWATAYRYRAVTSPDQRFSDQVTTRMVREGNGAVIPRIACAA